MNREPRGLFARRGIPASTLVRVVALVAVAFIVGIGAGWVTSIAPRVYRDLTSPAPSVSPSAAPSPLPVLSVEPSAPPAIERDLDDEDTEAGILSLNIPFTGAETFTHVPGSEEPSGDAATVRWVRVEVEDGLDVNSYALAEFTMETLNDNRGWGTGNAIEFVRTSGVPDIRVVIASPHSAAALCSDPRSGLPAGPVVEGSAEPSADDEPDDAAPPSITLSSACAAAGLVVMSLHDWTAGLGVYGDARQDSRRYLLSHLIGYATGHAEEACSGGRAPAMADQVEAGDACEVNPWPFPDAAPTPEPEPAS